MTSKPVVVVRTAGGDIAIDVLATDESGYFDRELESGSETLAAVRANVSAHNAMLDNNGDMVLVMPHAVLAYTYRFSG